jgi:hypothetical protein
MRKQKCKNFTVTALVDPAKATALALLDETTRKNQLYTKYNRMLSEMLPVLCDKLPQIRIRLKDVEIYQTMLIELKDIHFELYGRKIDKTHDNQNSAEYMTIDEKMMIVKMLNFYTEVAPEGKLNNCVKELNIVLQERKNNIDKVDLYNKKHAISIEKQIELYNKYPDHPILELQLAGKRCYTIPPPFFRQKEK